VHLYEVIVFGYESKLCGFKGRISRVVLKIGVTVFLFHAKSQTVLPSTLDTRIVIVLT